MFNSVILFGRLSSDVNHRFFEAGGGSLAHFSVAVSKKVKNAQNGYDEKSSFIPCKAFNKLADVLVQRFKKGDRIFVSGELEQESWEKEGAKHSRLILLVKELRFVEKMEAPQSYPQINIPQNNAGDYVDMSNYNQNQNLQNMREINKGGYNPQNVEIAPNENPF